MLARKDENWTIASRNNQPANADEVNRLIETLKNEQVTKFVADVASNSAKYGLDKPQLQVTLSSFASENTAETKPGEHPFATIAFGKIEGDDVYARLGDEPFIVAVKRNLLDKIFGRSAAMAGAGDLSFQARTSSSTQRCHRPRAIHRARSQERMDVGEGKRARSIKQVVQSLLNTSDIIACGSLGRRDYSRTRIRETADRDHVHDFAG